MKINFEEIRKGIQQGPSKRKSISSQDFDQLLKKEIAEDTEKTSPQQVPLSQIELANIEAAMRLEEKQNISPNQEKIMKGIEANLDNWEKYSQQLTQNNLKTCFNTLENILNEVSQMELQIKANGENPPNKQVSSLVKELKIMAMAEKARILTGDYS